MPATHFHLFLKVKKARSCTSTPRPKPFSDPIPVYLLSYSLALRPSDSPVPLDYGSLFLPIDCLLQPSPCYSIIQSNTHQYPCATLTVYILFSSIQYWLPLFCSLQMFESLFCPCKIQSKISFSHSLCSEGEVVLVLGSLLHCAEVNV